MISRGEPGESHVDVALSDAANGVADLLSVQLQVRCWSEEDWRGVAEELSAFTGDAVNPETMAWASQSIGIHVSPAACAELTELGSAADTVDERSARPLVAFAHELAYLFGISDDAIAECWGMQTAGDVALALGATRTDARALGRLHWARVFAQLPVELRSPDCRSGGRFDLDPARPAWP